MWNTYGEPGVVTTYLTTLFAGDPREAVAFLVSFVPTAWGLETGLSFKSDFRREQYNAAIQFAPAEMLSEALRRVYGNQLDEPQYHVAREMPLEERVAQQFAYIHKHVTTEMQKTELQTPAEEAGVHKDTGSGEEA
jgi:hypothetical protein